MLASLLLRGSLGRKAAHTGQEITLDDFMKSDQEYAPDVDKWTMDSPAPLVADAKGMYPLPQPGLKGLSEYWSLERFDF